MNEEQWLILKQKYPIGYKFSAKVLKIKPFGIFVEIIERPENSSEYLGLIDIGHTVLCKKDSQKLPLNKTQWPKEGSDINCIVSYYREHNKQLGLGWLGYV